MCTLPLRAVAAALVLLSAAAVRATTYEVGPGLAFTSIGAVPWESLVAGDVVRIHARPAPYAEKWVICAQGTQAQPIQVIGVPDGSGNLPVITGEGATTRAQLVYWGEERSLIKIGGASTPSCDTPAWIVLEGLRLRRAHSLYTFRNAAGTTTSYVNNASAVFVETGRNITVRSCVMEESGYGLFSAWQTEGLLVEGNLIQGNGIAGSIFHHNSYTAALGVTYRGNRFRPLCAGCPGNNLKDRSAGTVIEANWIEGGNRQLDLVEGEDDPAVPADPRYGDTYVAGNVLFENGNDGSSQIVHFGGDNVGNEAIYRPRLWFWNNTIVSTRTSSTTLLALQTSSQRAYAYNNIVWASAGGSQLWAVGDAGQASFAHNWLPAGWRESSGAGAVTDLGGNLTGTAPGFVDAATQNFHLGVSPCRGAAGTLPAQTATAPLEVVYVEHQQTASRTGQVPTDLGAFWDGTSAPTGGGGTTPPGTTPTASESKGCGCGSGSAPAGIAGMLVLLGLRRVRRSGDTAAARRGCR